MKIIFAGTPDFAVPCLQALLDSNHDVVAVYTQPDRPAGRGQTLHQSPVKQRALAHHLPIEQPQTLKNPEAQQQLARYAADLMIVVAYGLILPQTVLDTPRLGCINVHASLLPRWRGAAPIQRAILAGDDESGVTIMQMEAGLDTGPMLQKAHCSINPTDTAQDLHDRLTELGAQTLILSLNDIEAGKTQPEPQDDTKATYAAKLQKSEAKIDWTQPAAQIARQVRAFNPWPVAVAQWEKQTLRIWHAQALEQPAQRAPGSIVHTSTEGIDVATGDGCLRILKLQLPGKKPISAADFLNAQRNTPVTSFS